MGTSIITTVRIATVNNVINTEMSSPGFRFKQFYVAHDKCAMKVGTDGTLLGAWCPIGESHSIPYRILDIGTGSGLIALMLAQRMAATGTDWEIDAIDVDEGAVAQAQENSENSPWNRHINVHRAPIQDWRGDGYDLIVSNPPYFQNSLKNPDKGRETARHTDSLSYHDLIQTSAQKLIRDGRLCLILPAEAEMEIRKEAGVAMLTIEHIVYVHTKPGKDAKRILIGLRNTLRTDITERKEDFYIESEDSPRSEAYQQLTQEFYL